MTIPKDLNYFDTIYLRAAFYPLSAYKEIPRNENEIQEFVRSLYEDKTFITAIYLASPELYHEWKRSYTEPFTPEKTARLNRSIIKYFIRATSNCIPFGLFASYSLVDIKQHTAPKEFPDHTIYANINTDYIYLIIATLHTNPLIKSKLRYFVNNTLYQLGDHYRYVAADISGKTESRNYVLTSVEMDDVLRIILDECKKESKTRKELIDLLILSVEDVTEEDASGYIDELIDSYILNSSLDICLNDQSPIKQVYNFLQFHFKEKTGNEHLDEIMNGIKQIICSFDNVDLNNIDIPFCNSIEDIVKKITHHNGKKSIVNADLKNNSPVYEHNFEVDKFTVLKCIGLLSIFSTRNPHRSLSSFKNLYDFKKAFIARYGEDREVPFLQALDNECGIGYIQNLGSTVTFSDLIDDLPLIYKESGFSNLYSDKQMDAFWLNIFLKALKDNKTSIDLQQEDISEFEDRASHLAGTFPVLYRKYGDKLHMISAGGGSATHYLGRFSSNDEQLAAFSEEITSMEDNIFFHKISAEVLHTATNKAGNVSNRNIKRNYEIPILTRTTGHADVINPEDILISINNGRILLKSKKHNKEIVPFLSCAQNYHWDTLPYYHLLCDLQSQYRPNLLSLDFSTLIHDHFTFIPRVVYGDKIILSAATWKIKKSEFINISNKEQALLFEEFLMYRRKWNIPRYINLIENGHDLLLDMENEYMLDILFEKLNKKGTVIINECLYDIDSLQPCYASEFNISVYTKPEREILNDNEIVTAQKPVQERFIPGNEWMYYKIYTGTHTADNLLIDAISTIAEELKEEKLIDQWFFIRYNDPDFHLRVRFHVISGDQNKIIRVVNKTIQPYCNCGLIWKLDISTYERELNRYALNNIEISETLFWHDSEMVIKLIKALKESKAEELIWLYCIKCIDDLLQAFNFSLNDKLNIMQELATAFGNEFKIKKEAKIKISDKFRNNNTLLDKIMNNEGNAELNEVISHRNRLIRPLAADLLKKVHHQKIRDLVISHIHMHVNRMIRSNPRLHELVLYGILEKYYRKKYGTLNLKKV